MTCAGRCGRQVIVSRTWLTMSAAEREGKAELYSSTSCRSCALRPHQPAPNTVRGDRHRVLHAWDELGRPKRDTPEFQGLADRLGIRRISVIRNLIRNGESV